MTVRHPLALLAFAASVGDTFAADPKPFPGTPTKWQGFARHDFKVDGLDATVVVPEKPLPGRPWVWRGEFFRAFADCDVALVKACWHLACLKVVKPGQHHHPLSSRMSRPWSRSSMRHSNPRSAAVRRAMPREG